MMVIKILIRSLFNAMNKIKTWSETEKTKEEKPIYANPSETLFSETPDELDCALDTVLEKKTVFSLWDFVSFKEGSQAEHLISVVGFDEWLSMDEIRHRIESFLGVAYKNQRSLYPYIKTLVDCGFFDATSVGGIRKWRKKDYLIDLAVLDKKEKKSVSSKKNILKSVV